MSFETNEDRIERLENQVANLLKSNQKQQGVNVDLTELVFGLSKSQAYFMRMLAGSPLIADHGLQQTHLAEIARIENSNEQLEDYIGKVKKFLDGGPVPLRPPTPPGPRPDLGPDA